ncbi:MAG: molybdenum cofactor guanylyltransferase [Planctomycetales bacterium]|nr:molybdenum cofactor guanylyltransferase [Planctomycetales bacterium]
MPNAAIILAGGMSRRMGLPKADLPFGPETILRRILRILRPVVDQQIVVNAANSLPTALPGVVATQDRDIDLGPMEGIRVGLETAAKLGFEIAFVTSCDVPLLQPAFVIQLLELLDSHEVAVPVDEQFLHPISAVYRTKLHHRIECMLAEGQRRPKALIEQSDAKLIPVAELRSVDAELDSLRNCNRPEDYAAALSVAGFEMPDEIRQRLFPNH